MSTVDAPPSPRPTEDRERTVRSRLLLALPVVGFAAGIAVHRAPFAVVGPGLVAVLVVLVAVARVRRRRARARHGEEQRAAAPDDGPAHRPSGRSTVRPVLFFSYGCWPASSCGDLSVSTVALVLLGLLALPLPVLLVFRASRQRRVARARAAHPGTEVVVGALVDLASTEHVAVDRRGERRSAR